MPAASAIRAGAAYVELYAENNKLVRGLHQAEAKLKAFGQSVAKIGKQMLLAAGVAAAPMAYATKTFAGFEDQMKAVQAVSGATSEKFKRLNDQAKELGRTTSFTAAEVGAGQLNLARAGFNPAEIEAAIPSVLNLARATGTDLAQSAEIASGTLRAFEMDASNMAHVNDVLVAAANNSATTLEDLGETMKYVAPFAAEYGMTLEGTAKAAGVLANMQIKGSMAGTGMRKALITMSDPAIRKRLEGMGVDLSDFGESMVGLGRIMQTMTGPERIALAAEMFGDRAAGAVVKLAKADFPALSEAIDNAAGAADKTAKVMDSGLGGGFRRLMSAIEGVQIAVGEALGKALTDYADRLATVSGTLTAFINKHKEWIVGLAKAVAVVGAVGGALVAIGAAAKVAAFAIGTAALATKGLAVALGFLLANPIVLVFVAAAAAGVALARVIPTATKKLAELSSEAKKLQQIREKQNAADAVYLERLKELSTAGKLNNDQMQEAHGIIGDLTQRYGELGLSIDETTGKLKGLTAAQREMAHEQLLAAKMAALAAKEAEVGTLEKTTRRRLLGDTPQLRKAQREVERLKQEIAAAERAYEVRKKLTAIRGEGDAGTVPGAKGPEQAPGEKQVPKEMDPMERALHELEARFQEEMKAAKEAGAGLEEIAKIRKREETERRAIYSGKFPTPQRAIEDAATAVAGTFSAAAAVRLGMGGNAQERTAKAAEEIAENTRPLKRVRQLAWEE